MNDIKDKTKVIIFTTNFKVIGDISNFQDTRLTDYISEAKSFIAVTDVVVEERSGENSTFTAPFINIHKNHIEIIFPVEKMEEK